MRALTACAALALLAACGGGDPNGPLTSEESDQLNEAAAMLDAAPNEIVPPNAADVNEAANAT